MDRFIVYIVFMKTYPLELRQRIVDAVDNGLGTYCEIAEIFQVHESYIYRLLRWRNQRGDVAPLAHGGGAQPKLKDAELEVLAALVQEQPDATLEELCDRLKKRTTVAVSLPTVCRHLQKLRLPPKKKTCFAEEARPKERKAFQKEQTTFDSKQSVFIDEFAIHTGMRRRNARAPRGDRAEVTEPFQHEVKLSVVSALSLKGVGATMTIEGAVDGEVFHQYVQHVLLPELKRGNVVFMDNARIHYKAETIHLLKAAGVQVKHLPAYSPDFNPEENCISKIKTDMRAQKADTRRKLDNALVRAINRVTIKDIHGWFRHCGYTCPRK
jgi:transposase